MKDLLRDLLGRGGRATSELLRVARRLDAEGYDVNDPRSIADAVLFEVGRRDHLLKKAKEVVDTIREQRRADGKPKSEKAVDLAKERMKVAELGLSFRDNKIIDNGLECDCTIPELPAVLRGIRFQRVMDAGSYPAARATLEGIGYKVDPHYPDSGRGAEVKVINPVTNAEIVVRPHQLRLVAMGAQMHAKSVRSNLERLHEAVGGDPDSRSDQNVFDLSIEVIEEGSKGRIAWEILNAFVGEHLDPKADDLMLDLTVQESREQLEEMLRKFVGRMVPALESAERYNKQVRRTEELKAELAEAQRTSAKKIVVEGVLRDLRQLALDVIGDDLAPVLFEHKPSVAIHTEKADTLLVEALTLEIKNLMSFTAGFRTLARMTLGDDIQGRPIGDCSALELIDAVRQHISEQVGARDSAIEEGSEIIAELDAAQKGQPDGLYGKFRVSRVDGRDAPGGDRADAYYFVLDRTYDPYALPALEAYAGACYDELPELSEDLKRIIGTSILRRTTDPTFRRACFARLPALGLSYINSATSDSMPVSVVEDGQPVFNAKTWRDLECFIAGAETRRALKAELTEARTELTQVTQYVSRAGSRIEALKSELADAQAALAQVSLHADRLGVQFDCERQSDEDTVSYIERLISQNPGWRGKYLRLAMIVSDIGRALDEETKSEGEDSIAYAYRVLVAARTLMKGATRQSGIIDDMAYNAGVTQQTDEEYEAYIVRAKKQIALGTISDSTRHAIASDLGVEDAPASVLRERHRIAEMKADAEAIDQALLDISRALDCDRQREDGVNYALRLAAEARSLRKVADRQSVIADALARAAAGEQQVEERRKAYILRAKTEIDRGGAAVAGIGKIEDALGIQHVLLPPDFKHNSIATRVAAILRALKWTVHIADLSPMAGIWRDEDENPVDYLARLRWQCEHLEGLLRADASGQQGWAPSASRTAPNEVDDWSALAVFVGKHHGGGFKLFQACFSGRPHWRCSGMDNIEPGAEIDHPFIYLCAPSDPESRPSLPEDEERIRLEIQGRGGEHDALRLPTLDRDHAALRVAESLARYQPVNLGPRSNNSADEQAIEAEEPVTLLGDSISARLMRAMYAIPALLKLTRDTVRDEVRCVPATWGMHGRRQSVELVAGTDGVFVTAVYETHVAGVGQLRLQLARGRGTAGNGALLRLWSPNRSLHDTGKDDTPGWLPALVTDIDDHELVRRVVRGLTGVEADHG